MISLIISLIGFVLYNKQNYMEKKEEEENDSNEIYEDKDNDIEIESYYL